MFKPILPPLNPELLLSIAMNYSYPLDILFISVFLLVFIIAHVPLSHGYRRCFRHRCCLDTLFIFCFHFFPATFIVKSVKLKNCLRLIKLFVACSITNTHMAHRQTSKVKEAHYHLVEIRPNTQIILQGGC